jgi:uncharacterized membrane protein
VTEQPDHRERHWRMLQRHYGDGRSRGDVLADKFVAIFGSWSYIIWQTVVIVAWMIGNTLILRSWFHAARVPDPYPFILLNLMFSAQASYAAPLILMAQNRGAQRDKDFATHQFEIIDASHQMLGRNTELTATVKGNTDRLSAIEQRVEAIHAHVTAKPLLPEPDPLGTAVPPAAKGGARSAKRG